MSENRFAKVRWWLFVGSLLTKMAILLWASAGIASAAYLIGLFPIVGVPYVMAGFGSDGLTAVEWLLAASILAADFGIAYSLTRF